jgi:hypothetical protein
MVVSVVLMDILPQPEGGTSLVLPHRGVVEMVDMAVVLQTITVVVVAAALVDMVWKMPQVVVVDMETVAPVVMVQVVAVVVVVDKALQANKITVVVV